VISDIGPREKGNLRVEDLLARFYEVEGEAVVSDRMLLA
jgi:putative ABC transport system ATP-binding protein